MLLTRCFPDSIALSFSSQIPPQRQSTPHQLLHLRRRRGFTHPLVFASDPSYPSTSPLPPRSQPPRTRPLHHNRIRPTSPRSSLLPRRSYWLLSLAPYSLHLQPSSPKHPRRNAEFQRAAQRRSSQTTPSPRTFLLQLRSGNNRPIGFRRRLGTAGRRSRLGGHRLLLERSVAALEKSAIDEGELGV